MNVWQEKQEDFDLHRLHCYGQLKNHTWIENSVGTLGGGNHFIEIDQAKDGAYYLVIHTGSRNLGKQVAEIYQELAVELNAGKAPYIEQRERLIAEYKAAGRHSELQSALKQLADNRRKKIDFKLYVSLNPAHFITMSNPKDDKRGDTLTSCHSFNSTSYSYNNGCSGYARDEYTFITFVAADPSNPETLNNRKTMRQIFAYKPGNGLLLQSRLYNTSGGTYGAQEDSKLYRDLVQREISDLEGAPNLWQTYGYLFRW